MGNKVDTKSKLIRQLGDTVDLSSFDFQTGRNIPNPNQHSLLHQQPAIRSANMQRSIIDMLPSSVPPIKHPFEYRCRVIVTLFTLLFVVYFFVVFIVSSFAGLPILIFQFAFYVHVSFACSNLP